jgi:hypothetical protein
MTSPHQPQRPSWRCVACGDEWPCPSRRAELAAEGTGQVELALLMARYFQEAVEDHPIVLASALYTRFFGWVRWRHR